MVGWGSRDGGVGSLGGLVGSRGHSIDLLSKLWLLHIEKLPFLPYSVTTDICPQC